MKIIKFKRTSEPKWWVGEIHHCPNSYFCGGSFQLEESDEPRKSFSSGDGQHTGPEDIWLIACTRCGKEFIIRAEEV
jgi:hypothetical protein